MQPVWLCINSGRRFEETFENAQWRKVKQMQPVWLCILFCKRFEETFEKTQWGKIDQACAFLRIYDIQLSILIFNFCLVWLTDYPTRGGIAPLGKNKMIIMIIRTCTKSQNHLWCWWRWWWRVGQNTNSSLNILSVGFHSVHQGSWCSSPTSRSRLGVCCLFLRPEGQAGSLNDYLFSKLRIAIFWDLVRLSLNITNDLTNLD